MRLGRLQSNIAEFAWLTERVECTEAIESRNSPKCAQSAAKVVDGKGGGEPRYMKPFRDRFVHHDILDFHRELQAEP